MQRFAMGRSRGLLTAGVMVLSACLAGGALSPLAAQSRTTDSGTSNAMQGDAMHGRAMSGGAMSGGAMNGSAMQGQGMRAYSGAFARGATAVMGGYKITSGDCGQVLELTADFALGSAADPFVVLSNTTGLGDRTLWLGQLKEHSGAQQFSIPASTDLSAYNHVVLWSKTAKQTLAVAELPRGGAMSGMAAH